MKRFTYQDVSVDIADGVFYPTDTSRVIVDHLIASQRTCGTALDLGCGSGVVALLMARHGIASRVFASDVSDLAVRNTKDNARAAAVAVEARISSLFDAWHGMRFDLVVNDVSGISAALAPGSPWFSDNISCATGEEGTDLTLEIIARAPAYLNEGGMLLTPLLGLANHGRALDQLKSTFRSVELVGQKAFSLPRDMAQDHARIDALAARGAIDVVKQFGLYTWQLYLYEASDPR